MMLTMLMMTLMMIILMSMVMMLMTRIMTRMMMMMMMKMMMLITLSTFEAPLCSDLEHFQIFFDLLKDLSSFLDRLSCRAYL